MKAMFTETVLITGEMIDSEAMHTGDYNPLHIDDYYAQQKGFQNRIAHASILVNHISKILATDYPGPGTILLEQFFKYTAPVYANDIITINSTLDQIKDNKYAVNHTCVNSNGNVVLKARSVVIYKE